MLACLWVFSIYLILFAPRNTGIKKPQLDNLTFIDNAEALDSMGSIESSYHP